MNYSKIDKYLMAALGAKTIIPQTETPMNIQKLPLSVTNLDLEPRSTRDYRVTRQQFTKLQRVIPERLHRAVYDAILCLNETQRYNYTKERYEDVHDTFGEPGIALFVNTDGLIHLEVEVDGFHEMLFFKMDSGTDIVIHEVAL